MQGIAIIAAVTATLAFGLAPSPAAPGASAHTAGTLTLSAAKKPDRHGTAASGQIACTPTGCQRIPPDCHPEPGFDFWGNPTGYDVIVCPRR